MRDFEQGEVVKVTNNSENYICFGVFDSYLTSEWSFVKIFNAFKPSEQNSHGYKLENVSKTTPKEIKTILKDNPNYSTETIKYIVKTYNSYQRQYKKDQEKYSGVWRWLIDNK